LIKEYVFLNIGRLLEYTLIAAILVVVAVVISNVFVQKAILLSLAKKL